MNLFNVLSFDPTKIKLVYAIEGKIIVKKKTVKMEFVQITKAYKHLLNHPVAVKNNSIFILPAPVIEWRENDNILVTEYCDGINLEYLLRSASMRTRKQWIGIFKELFLQFKQKGFLWGDFAPRNMIFNNRLSSIRIVDFERKLNLYDNQVESEIFSRYVRNYSQEEFACFLFRNEQSVFFPEIITFEPSKDIPVSELQSRRKKELLRRLFGYKTNYKVEEIQKAESLMADVATPFVIDNVVIYPMDIIDKITSKEGPKTYVEIVNILCNINDIGRKYVELVKIAEIIK